MINSDILSDLPDDAPIDKKLLSDMKSSIGTMSKDILSGKIKETEIIKESMADGGPTSPNEAIIVLMDACKVGIRRLATQSGVKRGKLVKMIDGQIPMPAEVMEKLYEVFKQAKPSLFAFENE